jgi:co-chaperonin GroES (HSP10)
MLKKLLSDHVLVALIKAKEQKTAAGLVVPQSPKNAALVSARVVMVGPGKVNPEGKFIPVAVQVDDIVLVRIIPGDDGPNGTILPYYDEETGADYRIVREHHIIGVVGHDTSGPEPGSRIPWEDRYGKPEPEGL